MSNPLGCGLARLAAPLSVKHLTNDEAREMTRSLAWEYVRDLRDKVKELEKRLKVLEDSLKDGNRRVK